MRSKVTLRNKSIDNAGIPSDYKLAIAEYIWNSFDAKATNVNIQFEANEIGYISHFIISDNGEGINLSTLLLHLGLSLIRKSNKHFNGHQRLEEKWGKVDSRL